MTDTLTVMQDTADIRWSMPVDALMSNDYALREEALNRLYEKAKAAQWDVATDVDWSHDLDPANPLGMPDPTLLIYGTELWGKLSDTDKREVRHHAQGWLLSQILHGEQAALICASKLASAENGLSARLCAAAQMMDEARHVEAYAKLVNEKLDVSYPMSRSLKGLLHDTITSSALDMTNLGMQVLVEGIALSIFQSVVAYSTDPFIKDLFVRIQRDESRHFAVGRITLCRVYAEMSAVELREREEFVCEGAAVLYEHLCADDIWEPMGLSKRECSAMVRESPVSSSIRRSIFRRLVPTIREMGLLTPTVQATFENSTSRLRGDAAQLNHDDDLLPSVTRFLDRHRRGGLRAAGPARRYRGRPPSATTRRSGPRRSRTRAAAISTWRSTRARPISRSRLPAACSTPHACIRPTSARSCTCIRSSSACRPRRAACRTSWPRSSASSRCGSARSHS